MKKSQFMKRIIGLFVILFYLQSLHAQAPQLGKASVKDVVNAMTAEEKVKMLVGMGFKIDGLPPGFLPPGDPADDSIGFKVNGTSGRIHGIPRLGIPMLTLADGPAGVHIWDTSSEVKLKATALPNASLLASTWDTAIVKKMGFAFGREAREYGIDIILAPAMNIQRNPLGGRNFEYYSEDPVLSGNISAAMINGIQSAGEGVSMKHFVANNSESNRMKLNTVVSERALREIYLRGFEIAAKKANPWTIMSSYNLINGIYTSENKDLLTTILRDEWHYKGFVMSDWFAGNDPVAQINAGNNLLMPGNWGQQKAILSGVKHDSISMQQVNTMVEQILQTIIHSPTFKKYPYSNKPDLVADAAMSKEAAQDGMILLKNSDNTLPLKKSQSVVLYGNSSYDLIAGGTGSGDVQRAYTISLVDGLINSGFKPDEAIQNAYQSYLKAEKAKRPKPSLMTILNPPPPIKELTFDDAAFAAALKNADVAILSIGRNAGEGKDRVVDNDFNLTAEERFSIHALSNAYHAQHKKLVVVINSGGVIETASWRDEVDAILMAWQPGMEGGNAMAAVLSGAVNPSAKLPVSFPVTYADVPSAKGFPGSLLNVPSKSTSMLSMDKPMEIVYEDGIYVGYRYYSSFHVKPAYEFGFGLSYTQFFFSKLSLSAGEFKNQVTVKLTVTNIGKVAGKEVVQLYLSAPFGKLDKPEIELKAFAKTALLQPGASQTVSFVVNARDLASFDTGSSSWIAAAGTYTVKVGSSSADIRSLGDFKLSKDLVVEKAHKAMPPKVSITELVRK